LDFESFVVWVYEDFFAGAVALRDRADDLIRQRRLFDERRKAIETEYYQRVAGYVADKFVSADTTGELLERVQEAFPGRMLYFEPIGYPLVTG